MTLPMHKLIVQVTEPVRDALAIEADNQGLSIAALICRLITQRIHVPGERRQFGEIMTNSKTLAEVRTFYPGPKIKAIKAIRTFFVPALRLPVAKDIADQIWEGEAVHGRK